LNSGGKLQRDRAEMNFGLTVSADSTRWPALRRDLVSGELLVAFDQADCAAGRRPAVFHALCP